MSNDARWYVVHTYSGYENKVATDLEIMVKNRNLEDMILEVKIPTELVTEVKDGKTKEYERKLFPGYVLVKMVMDDDSWYVVRNTRGVTGFVGPGSKPVPLTPEEIQSLGVEKRDVVINFAVGDSVRISEGPLADFIGTVDEVDTNAMTVKVTVSMFGRETNAELPINQVEAL